MCTYLLGPRPDPAFSLIELLAVIAVVAVLAGLLFPVLGRAKVTTRNLECRHNLRQWSLATLLFAAENDDRLPKDGAPNGTSIEEGWYVDLPRTLGIAAYRSHSWRTNAAIDPGRSLWICPSNPRRSNGRNLFHYCLNQHVNGTGADRQVQLFTINRPAVVVWLFDNGRLAAVAQQNNVPTNLHRHGAQFAFLDGHAAWFDQQVYWDFSRQLGRTNHPDLQWYP
jgi:prepilin-type N-terminal cleavage/methylation domain-containing protein/prepilin-type processing-associated H-X9-DG protein